MLALPKLLPGQIGLAALILLPLLVAAMAGFYWATKAARKLSAELNQSKEQLRRAHIRFGDALRSTHDMQGILEVILDIGLETVGAERGALLMVDGAGLLCVKKSTNLEPPLFEVRVGAGLVGYIAETGQGIRIPGGSNELIPAPTDAEPKHAAMVGAPLFSQKKVIGVLALYDKKRSGSFGAADLDALLSRADQASVAIENVVLHQEAQRMAITDGLTSIWNHRYFQLQFEQELDRAGRFGRAFSLIMLDVDDFKTFNDTYGHRVGDFVLVELASRVNSIIRDADIFARYGGEEFALMLPETDAAGGLATAEKIRRIISERPFEGEVTPEPLAVTVSLGVACSPEAGKDKEALFEAADKALLKAKSEGKNRVVLA